MIDDESRPATARDPQSSRASDSLPPLDLRRDERRLTPPGAGQGTLCRCQKSLATTRGRGDQRTSVTRPNPASASQESPHRLDDKFLRGCRVGGTLAFYWLLIPDGTRAFHGGFLLSFPPAFASPLARDPRIFTPSPERPNEMEGRSSNKRMERVHMRQGLVYGWY